MSIKEVVDGEGSDDASPENLRKFLESDDLAMVLMGLSMAKGNGIPDHLLGLVASFYMWHDDKAIRASAKSAFMKQAPDNLKPILKKNWEVRYRTLSDEDALQPKVENLFKCFKKTQLHCVDTWSQAMLRNHGPIGVFIAIIERFDTDTELKDALRNKGLPISGSKTKQRERLEEAGISTSTQLLIKALEYWNKEDPTYSYYIRHCKEGLERTGDTRAIQPIIDSLGKNTSASNIEETAKALKKFGKSAIDQCIQTLQDSSVKTRVGVVGVLAIIGDERAPLIDALADKKVRYGWANVCCLIDIQDSKINAAESLGKIGGKRAVEPLLKMLSDSKALVQYMSAEALGESGDKRAVKPLIELLKVSTNNATTDYTDVREAAAKALGKLGDSRMETPLLKMLEGINANKLKNKRNDKDEDARMKGIEALLNCNIKKEQDVITVLTAYVQFYGLSNSHGYEFNVLHSKFTRWFAELEPKYLEKLFIAANSMGKLSDYGKYGVIPKKEEDDYFDIWGCADENFSEIIQEFGEKAIDPLIDILGNKDYHYFLHQKAAVELGNFGEYRAKEVLTKAFESYSAHYPASDVHDAAAKALKKIKPADGKEHIFMSDKEIKKADETVSKLVKKWSKKLGGKKSKKAPKKKAKPVSEFKFESSSTRGKFYTVTVDGGYYECTCPGFMYRKSCSHLEKARYQIEPGNEKETVQNDFKVTEVNDDEMPIILGMYLFGESNSVRVRAKKIFEYNYTKGIEKFVTENLTEKFEIELENRHQLGFWNDQTRLNWSGIVLGSGRCRICKSTIRGAKFLMEKSPIYSGSAWKESYCTPCYSEFETSNNQYKLIIKWWRNNFENIISSGGIQRASVRKELEEKQKKGPKKQLGTNEINDMLKKSDPLIVFDGLQMYENKPEKAVLSHIIPLSIWDEEKIVRDKAEAIIVKNLSTDTAKLVEKIRNTDSNPVADYELLTVSQLKNILKQRKLPVSGSKDTLIQRITKHNIKIIGDFPKIIESLAQELKNSELDIGPFILSLLKYIKIDDSDLRDKIVDILNKHSDKAETYENDIFSLGWGVDIDAYPIDSYKSCLRSLSKKESSTKDMIKYLRKKDADLDDVQIILENMGPLSKSNHSAIEKYLRPLYLENILDSIKNLKKENNMAGKYHSWAHYSSQKEETYGEHRWKQANEDRKNIAEHISKICDNARRILIENGYNEMELLRKNIEIIDNSGYPSAQCIGGGKRLGEIRSKESLELLVELVEKVKTKKLEPEEIIHSLPSLNNLKDLATGKTKTKIIGIMNYLLNQAAKDDEFFGTSNGGSESDEIIGNIADILGYYRNGKSAEPLIKALTLSMFWRGHGKFAMAYPDGEFSSGRKIVDALNRIGNRESKDSLIAGLAQFELNIGEALPEGHGTKSEGLIFASLLSVTVDVKKLKFFTTHWSQAKYGSMSKEEKELYKITLTNNKEDIANLIKYILSSSHPIYKSYFSNIEGKNDPRKFLMSDDPAMQLMGLSLAKGIKYPEDIQPLIISLALFSTEKNIREEALKCIKDIGIEKVPMPTKEDWKKEMYNYSGSRSYRDRDAKDITPVIKSLLSLESAKSLPYLKYIYIEGIQSTSDFKFDPHEKLIVDEVSKFCNRDECLEFYDELINSSKHYFRVGKEPRGQWHPTYHVKKENKKRLALFFSAYVKLNAQERHGIIFSRTFDELVFAITHKATTEEKQKPIRGFIREGLRFCFKLDKNSPDNSDRTLLLLKHHLFSTDPWVQEHHLDYPDFYVRNSRECKIAAAQIFEMLYKSRQSRRKISEIVEPARKDSLTLVRKSLKSIK